MDYFKGLMNSLERGVVSPVYLLYGEEQYLKEKAIERFKELLLPVAPDFNLDLVDGETTDPGQVVSLAQNLPFMAERRLVIVKNAPWFRGKGRVKASNDHTAQEEKTLDKETQLLGYLNQPSTSTCLIFLSNDAPDRRKKTFKAIETAGQALDFKALKPVELVSWVTNKIKTAGKKIDPGAARSLVEANGKLGLLNLEKEVEKLLAFVGDCDSITLEDVNQVGVINVEQNIFMVVDQALSGASGKALQGIRELLALKEQPPKILAMLARQFRVALQVDVLVREGCAEKEVAKKLGLHDFVVRKAITQAKRTGSSRVEWALNELAMIDAGIKKGQQDFLPALEYMFLNLNKSSSY